MFLQISSRQLQLQSAFIENENEKNNYFFKNDNFIMLNNITH